MNEQEIDQLEAGPEMDALVAEYVMNFSFNSYGQSFTGKGYPGWHDMDKLPRYSTDIAVAWRVVEKMRTEYEFFLWTSGSTGKDFGCRVRREGDEWNDDLMAFATTAPLAIVKAALKACGAHDSTHIHRGGGE